MPDDDRFAQAQELLDAGQPAAWLFQEDGLRVVGEVLSAFRSDTQYAKDVPVLTLRLQDGSVRSVWGTGVLADKFQKLSDDGLAPGDIVGVERGAEKTLSRGGDEYWPYQVVRVPGPNSVGSMLTSGAAVPALPATQAAEIMDGFQGSEVVAEVVEEPYRPGSRTPDRGGWDDDRERDRR